MAEQLIFEKPERDPLHERVHRGPRSTPARIDGRRSARSRWRIVARLQPFMPGTIDAPGGLKELISIAVSAMISCSVASRRRL